MHYKDNFEEALSRMAFAYSVVSNAGYHRSDRDVHLAERLHALIKDVVNARCNYDENGNLKEMYK
jgi:hypothetical protein